MAKRIVLPKTAIFDWNQGNTDHIKKHNVTQSECEDIFFNDPISFADKKHSQNEQRFLAYGMTNEQRYLTVVFTIRMTKMRVVSARDQNKKEKEVFKANQKIERR